MTTEELFRALRETIEKELSNDTDKTSRAWAWYDCNAAFGNAGLSRDEKARELYIFLANWGMVTRRSFVMQHTWRILRGVVDVLCDPSYKDLRNPEIATVRANIDTLVDLYDKVDGTLRQFHKGHTNEPVSYTLVSKILLGAMGCTVAYDTNVCNALAESRRPGSEVRIEGASFNRRSVLSLCDFYTSHNEEFESIRSALPDEIKCPPFKLLDLALWAYWDKYGTGNNGAE